MSRLFILSFFFLLISSTSRAQVSIEWSDEMIVHNDLALGNARPRIALSGDNTPVVIWGKRNTGELWTSFLLGDSFSSAQYILPGDMKSFAQDWAGSEISAWGDTLYVAVKLLPENEEFIYLIPSYDGGRNFGDTIRVNSNPWSRFPNVVFTDKGTIHVSYMNFGTSFTDPHYVIQSKKASEGSFKSLVNASSGIPGEACDCCPAEIIAEDNDVSVLFRNNDNNIRNIHGVSSSDEGMNFNSAEELDHTNWQINGCPSTGPSAIYNGDSMYYVWMSAATGSNRIMLGSSGRTGLNSGFNLSLSETGSANYPVIAGKWGTMAVVWQEDGKIMLALSNTGVEGLLSNPHIQVNSTDDGIPSKPHMVFRGNEFHIVWQNNLTRSVNYRRLKITETLGISHPKEIPVIVKLQEEGKYAIRSGSNARISIRDINGRCLLEKVIKTGDEVVDISIYNKGIYTVQIVSDNGIQLYKITN